MTFPNIPQFRQVRNEQHTNPKLFVTIIPGESASLQRLNCGVVRQTQQAEDSIRELQAFAF